MANSTINFSSTVFIHEHLIKRKRTWTSAILNVVDYIETGINLVYLALGDDVADLWQIKLIWFKIGKMNFFFYKKHWLDKTTSFLYSFQKQNPHARGNLNPNPFDLFMILVRFYILTSSSIFLLQTFVSFNRILNYDYGQIMFSC